MNENTIMLLDGLTVQNTGELLYDPSETTIHRTKLRDTYIQCIEDFAQAIVLGTKCAVTGNLPNVGRHSPGKDLVNEFDSRFEKVERGKAITPDECLKDINFRELVQSDLENVDKAFSMNRIFWEQWIIRDAISSLGDNETIFVSKNDAPQKYEPTLFTFGKTPEYLVDRHLQSIIPTDFITDLTNVLLKYANTYILPKEREKNGYQYSFPALYEFVSRNTLTLISIYWWYIKICKEKTEKIDYSMLSPTRNSVKRARYTRGVDRTLRQLERITTRHALFEALEINNRTELTDSLYTLANNRAYSTIRALYTEIGNALKECNRDISKIEKEIQKIIDEINGIARGGPISIIESITIDAGVNFAHFKGGIKVDGDKMSSALSKRNAIRELSKKWSSGDYQRRLSQVFPELGVG